uniref:Uncharacterized protein n=1 Tax=Glossina brevipalpis TaxID=37001 RepID=A0A1A9WGK7_9MUSC
MFKEYKNKQSTMSKANNAAEFIVYSLYDLIISSIILFTGCSYNRCCSYRHVPYMLLLIPLRLSEYVTILKAMFKKGKILIIIILRAAGKEYFLSQPREWCRPFKSVNFIFRQNIFCLIFIYFIIYPPSDNGDIHDTKAIITSLKRKFRLIETRTNPQIPTTLQCLCMDRKITLCIDKVFEKFITTAVDLLLIIVVMAGARNF